MNDGILRDIGDFQEAGTGSPRYFNRYARQEDRQARRDLERLLLIEFSGRATAEPGAYSKWRPMKSVRKPLTEIQSDFTGTITCIIQTISGVRSISLILYLFVMKIFRSTV